jgi:hypothetical protein
MLVLNSASVSLYNNTREEMNRGYAACTNEKDILSCSKHYKQLIEGFNSNNDEPGEDEVDAGHCAILFNLNVKLQKKAFNRLLLLSSHGSDTIESSNTTQQEPTNMTTQAPIMNSTMNIESMSLQELAALQLRIAQRMQDLVAKHGNVENPKECDIPQEKLEDVVPVVATKPDVEVVEPAPKAARVKKSKATKSTLPIPNTPEGVTIPLEADLPRSDVSTMKYADLRSFISKATKSNDTAKEHAQSIARKYGAKSWATVGRSGYEEIYKLINK